MGESIRAVIDAGAIGFNLEDATGDSSQPLFPLEQQIERIRAAREAANNTTFAQSSTHARMFTLPKLVSLRVDLPRPCVGSMPTTKLAQIVYLCPGVTDIPTLTQLVHSVAGPLNVLAGPGMAPVADLQRIGIARLSVGSAIMRATLALARDAADELLQKGTYNTFLDRNIPYREVNELMK